jgi:chromate transporter
MLLPGPEAMQIATYAGWRMHGVRGGLAAGLLFVLPGAALMLALALAYAALGDLGWVPALFLGIKAAVVVIVVEALLRVARKALGRRDLWAVAALAFVAMFFFAAPFPLIILAAALYGALRPGGGAARQVAPPLAGHGGRALRTALLWAAIWAAPLTALQLADPDGLLLALGLFFSKLAVVTFGGAYAVLAYMAQEAVEVHGWLSAGAMLDGLGLAETTPGPLILVTEFVGFLAGHGQGGIALGVAAALLTLWVTFAPCFLWIFVGAPYIGWITAQPRLQGALRGITAAVVGVILNLSLWFALHVFFADVTRRAAGPLVLWQPDPASLDPAALALACLAALLLLGLRWGLVPVLAISAVLGLAWRLAGGAPLAG